MLSCELCQACMRRHKSVQDVYLCHFDMTACDEVVCVQVDEFELPMEISGELRLYQRRASVGWRSCAAAACTACWQTRWALARLCRPRPLLSVRLCLLCYLTRAFSSNRLYVHGRCLCFCSRLTPG